MVLFLFYNKGSILMKYNYFDILNKSQKKIFILIIFLTFVGSILETIGIASVFPILSVITTDQNELQNYKYIILLNKFLDLDFTNKQNAIKFFAVFLVIFFLCKNLYLFFIKFFSESYLFKLRHELSYKIFKNIIYTSYSEIIKKNSSFYITLSINVVSEIVNSIFSALVFLIKEILLFIIILILLLIFNFTFTLLTLIIFTSFSLIIYLFSKNKLSKWSKKKIFHDELQLRNINESISLIKFLKILNLEKFFLDKFSINNLKTNMLSRNLVVLDQIPNLFFETIIIFFVGLTILVFNDTKDILNLIPILAVFALIALRLRSSVTYILKSLHNLKYGREFIKTYIDNLSETNFEKPDFIRLKNSINVKNLNFSYKQKKIINNFSLKINKGDIIGIKGQTGSGKTTLIDLITGLLKKNSGEIFVDEKKLTDQNLFNLLKIGYVPQDVYLIDGTIRENIDFSLFNENKNLIKKVLDISELSEFVYEAERGVNTYIAENGKYISGGQKQRIGIARAIFSNPDLLILDEATNALDKVTQKKIYKNLRQLKITTIIISHQTDNLDICDKIINFENFQGKYE